MNSNGELKTEKENTAQNVKIPTLDDSKFKELFADIAQDTLEKIKRNPFWNEYTKDSKQKMISKYFDNKIKRAKYNSSEYSPNDKLTFIDKVLKSVV